VAVQEVHDVVWQRFLTLGREVPDIAKENRDLEFFPLPGAKIIQFLEIKDDDFLRPMQQPADDYIAVNLCLARQARVVVPTSLGCDSSKEVRGETCEIPSRIWTRQVVQRPCPPH